jgi:hypothetical protein
MPCGGGLLSEGSCQDKENKVSWMGAVLLVTRRLPFHLDADSLQLVAHQTSSLQF